MSSTAPTSCSGSTSAGPSRAPYGATIGVLGSTLALFEDGATHVGVASDHIIESFRNDLWPGYKTSAGMPPELLAQIPVMEDALAAMGVTVWAMVEYEADDAMGAAAALAAKDGRVEHAFSCAPPTRTSASAWSAPASCSSIDARASWSTRTA